MPHPRGILAMDLVKALEGLPGVAPQPPEWPQDSSRATLGALYGPASWVPPPPSWAWLAGPHSHLQSLRVRGRGKVALASAEPGTDACTGALGW